MCRSTGWVFAFLSKFLRTQLYNPISFFSVAFSSLRQCLANKTGFEVDMSSDILLKDLQKVLAVQL